MVKDYFVIWKTSKKYQGRYSRFMVIQEKLHYHRTGVDSNQGGSLWTRDWLSHISEVSYIRVGLSQPKWLIHRVNQIALRTLVLHVIDLGDFPIEAISKTR